MIGTTRGNDVDSWQSQSIVANRRTQSRRDRPDRGDGATARAVAAMSAAEELGTDAPPPKSVPIQRQEERCSTRRAEGSLAAMINSQRRARPESPGSANPPHTLRSFFRAGPHAPARFALRHNASEQICSKLTTVPVFRSVPGRFFGEHATPRDDPGSPGRFPGINAKRKRPDPLFENPGPDQLPTGIADRYRQDCARAGAWLNRIFRLGDDGRVRQRRGHHDFGFRRNRCKCFAPDRPCRSSHQGSTPGVFPTCDR